MRLPLRIRFLRIRFLWEPFGFLLIYVSTYTFFRIRFFFSLFGFPLRIRFFYFLFTYTFYVHYLSPVNTPIIRFYEYVLRIPLLYVSTYTFSLCFPLLYVLTYTFYVHYVLQLRCKTAQIKYGFAIILSSHLFFFPFGIP